MRVKRKTSAQNLLLIIPITVSTKIKDTLNKSCKSCSNKIHSHFFFPLGRRLPARQMDMLSTQTLSVYNKWPCYLSFILLIAKWFMLWLSGVKHYHSVFQHKLSGEKYAMQLRSLDIMDGCSLNATTLSLSESVAPPRRCIPEEQFTEPLMLNTSPQPFLLLSATLALLHSDKLAVLSRV